MITELTMKKWAKHDGRTFTFAEGMNKIIGENEAGKSLIFEAIDFCFHGSEALRLSVSMYPNNLFAEVKFSVRGKNYRVERGLKTAQLFDLDSDKLIAKGNTAVTAEIRKIFGYTRNVFMTSNYSSQDSIQHLSKMTPAERKRTIDNVIGLTAVEKVLKNHKGELTLLRREREGVKNREPDAPVPLCFEYDPQTEEKIKQKEQEIADANSVITTQKANAAQHKALDSAKPADVPLLSEDGLITEYTSEEIKARVLDIARYTGRVQHLIELRDTHYATPIEVMAEPSKEGLIEGLTAKIIDEQELIKQRLISDRNNAEAVVSKLPDLSGCVEYTEKQISDAQAQQDLYQDWLQVERLKAQGSITCTHCSGEVLLAASQIEEKYSHVPSVVEKPVLTAGEMIKTNSQLRDLLETESKAKQKMEQSQLALADFDAQWYSESALHRHLSVEYHLQRYEENKIAVAAFNEQGELYKNQVVELESKLAELQTNWFTDAELDQHAVAQSNKAKNDINRSAMESWENSKRALQPFDEQKMLAAEQELDRLSLMRIDLHGQLAQWKVWSERTEKYNRWLVDFKDVEDRMDEENLAVEALNNFKDKIKTTILPSVNRVASTWMHKMSEGKHVSVTLTDEMQILVNDYPIEALSVSGRALGHLSLRMALGQVLTNSVFPVFMADEIDSSMRDGRAQNVLDGLTDMLKGSMKQVILISHRDLEHVEHTIEV